MKKIIPLLVLLFALQVFNANSQTLNCSITCSAPVESKQASSLMINCDTICVGATATYCTEEYAGAIYGWSVVGSGVQIVGPRNERCVTVMGVSPGTYQLCLTKSVNGYQSCCVCKTIVVIPCEGNCCPPCTLEVVPTDTNGWDPTCYGCEWNRVKLDIRCQGSTSYALRQWMSANNVTADIKWEILDGTFHFYTPITPCGSDACGVRCELRTYNYQSGFESAYICQCTNVPFFQWMTAQATIQFKKNGVVCCTRVVNTAIYFNIISNGCPSKINTGNAALQSFKVRPNPAVNNAAIDLELQKAAVVEAGLFDNTGNLVKKVISPVSLPAGKHSLKFSTMQVPDNTYQVVIMVNGEKAASDRLVIMKQ